MHRRLPLPLLLALLFLGSPTATETAHAGYGDGSIPDAIAACEGNPYDLIERDGDLYVHCLGATLDWMHFSASVSVADGVATVTVTRADSGDGRRALLRYETTAGTALPGRDFDAVSGRLYFGDAERTRTFTVALREDPDATAARSFHVTFDNAAGQGLVVPAPAEVVLPGPDVGGGEPGGREPGGGEPGGGEPGGGENPGGGEPGGGEPGGGENPGGGAGPQEPGPEQPREPVVPAPAPETPGPAGGGAGAVQPARPTPSAGRRPSAPARRAARVVRTLTIRFCAGCTTPSARDRARLKALRGRLGGARLLEVVGHADASGERAVNRRLAGRRARVVARLLLRGAGRPSRVVVRNAGTSRPVASNTTLDGRARNRRVSVRLVTTR
jgi:outer membrane protein OmpA-like peptidoglycan-associated protein